jgi:hypothetical protein
MLIIMGGRIWLFSIDGEDYKVSSVGDTQGMRGVEENIGNEGLIKRVWHAPN